MLMEQHLQSDSHFPDPRCHRMSLNTRLWLCGVVILVSAIYATLVAADRDIAQVAAMGYIVVVLTIFIVIQLRSRT